MGGAFISFIFILFSNYLMEQSVIFLLFQKDTLFILEPKIICFIKWC